MSTRMSVRSRIFTILTVLCFCPSMWSQVSMEEASAIAEQLAREDKARIQSLEQGNANTTSDLRIRYFKIDPTLGIKSQTSPDTLSLDFQNNAFPERNNTPAALHTGSFGSPFQSKVFTHQTAYSPFLFLRSYEQWLTDPAAFVYINTTKPYTNLSYNTTFGNEPSQEENFTYFVSANANKYLNLGASYEIVYARGFYRRSATRGKLGNLFGNYQGPRYEAFWRASFNTLENMENGGITDVRYITQPLLMSGGLREYESTNIPVNLEDAQSHLKNQQLFVNHKYNIGFNRVDKNDSTQSSFIPVTSIIHTLFIDRSQRNYLSTSANPQFYDSIAHISPTHTADTAALFHVRNTIGLSLREDFHAWAKMGLTAFIEHDYRKYTGLAPNATLHDSINPFSRWQSHTENLLWGGVELSKQKGKVLTYSVLGKICLLGDDIGDYEIDGKLQTDLTLWNHPVRLQAGGYMKYLQPDYFLETYYSNHFKWDNPLKNEYKTRIYGVLDIPELGFHFNATVENIYHPVYFNTAALPAQYDGNIQIVSANWKQHLSKGILNWDNDVVYQVSSRSDIVPLPHLTVYSNLYLKGTLSKVLLSHLGIDCRYHTAYYAPAYMPATGQFHTQKSVKVGNYPYMNAYVNFHLKRMRFFITYTHLSRLFADPNYFSAPYYPMNPAIIKAGLSWNFYD